MNFSYSYTDNQKVLIAGNREIETYRYPPFTKEEILNAIRDFIMEEKIENEKIIFTLYPKTPRELNYFREGENWIWNPKDKSLIPREPNLF
ncbi:hypothetical protein [Helicobacter sp. MIT 05-5294]|uniref:hypothetical protein n=1 Tax=Helicobacter sp. MIT 05-5294 TaxID=1548150 RepID=UPI00051FC2C4|nr:hypothetical protein [Helicobacter sp. MIT 05-5294]TLD85552.1 hypothetical protein LS69_008875 [Helicobacter sp. MIT 05-5294]